MKRHSKYKFNYDRDHIQIVISRRDKTCHYCSKTIDALEQAISISNISLHSLPVYRFLHLHCWLSYNNAPNKERNKIMSEKKTGQMSFDDVPDINKARSDKKLWDYTHSEILDLEIVILEAREIETMYGDAILSRCVVQDKEVNVMFGAVLLVSVLRQVADKLPVKATVIKSGQFYSFK